MAVRGQAKICVYDHLLVIWGSLRSPHTCGENRKLSMCIYKCIYRIAGKFGGNYIWQNGLQAAKNKYWQNLNLAIGNFAHTSFYYIIVLSYGSLTWFY